MTDQPADRGEVGAHATTVPPPRFGHGRNMRPMVADSVAGMDANENPGELVVVVVERVLELVGSWMTWDGRW